MVLNPHAESIDEDSDHDPAVEVFTFHNPLQFFSEVNPGANRSVFVLHDAPPPAPTSSTSQISSLRESYEVKQPKVKMLIWCCVEFWIQYLVFFVVEQLLQMQEKTQNNPSNNSI